MASNTQPSAPDRDVSNISNMSKESTMSVRLDHENTSSSMDENVFEDARRALAPSGVTPKQFTGPEGSMRYMSPHMVNVHQFYPEITFSLDKGTVGEIVETPKNSARALPKIASHIDFKETIPEEKDENSEEMNQEDSTLDAEPSFYTEEKNLKRGKIRRASLSTENDDEDDGDLFQTQVDEETLAAAKARQGEGGGLFYPETWGPARTRTWTVQEIAAHKAEEHCKEGLLLVEEKDFEQAIKCFTKAINLQSRHIDYYTHRGEAFLVLCDFQSAILNYKKACVLDPDNQQYYNRLAFIYYFHGQCLFDQKLFPEALEAFSRAAEMRPEIIGYHMRSIACLAALQRHGECLALVNKRLEAENDNPDLYVMRARLHQLFRNTTLCYYDIKDALALDPDHSEARRLMIQLEERAMEYRQQSTNMSLTGRNRDALQKISIAIETNPSVAEFHNVRGAVHRKLGDFNAAIDDYLLALDKTDHNEDDPVYIEAQRQLLLTYNDFAVECFKKGFFEEAIILLNKAIKGEKGEKGLYVNRGDCFFRESNLQFALADYHQALELDPQDDHVRRRVALVHNEYGVQEYLDKHNKEAEGRFTLSIQHDPMNAKYYISRARARHLLENLHGARQDVLMSVHLDPANPEIPSLMQRFFHGKSTKEVLGSQAAVAIRKQIQNLVVTASPVKLDPVSTSVSRETTRTLRTGTHKTRATQSAGFTSSGRTCTEDDELTEDDSSSLLSPSAVDLIPPIAGSAWKAGECIPDLKACMLEKEFNVKIAKEKQQINHKVKDALKNRKSLSASGARIAGLPDVSSLPRKLNPIGKETLAIKAPKKSTGWRNFGLGISGGGSY